MNIRSTKNKGAEIKGPRKFKGIRYDIFMTSSVGIKYNNALICLATVELFSYLDRFFQ